MIRTMSLVSAMLLVNGVAMAGPVATEETAVYGLAGLDSNADGQISHGEAAHDPLLADAFITIDADADGQLTDAEFDAYFEAGVEELIEAE